tara:strand:+ start:482 stop:943 length:462 start_codon:yes stop_codon:yes gene_type:complete
MLADEVIEPTATILFELETTPTTAVEPEILTLLPNTDAPTTSITPEPEYVLEKTPPPAVIEPVVDRVLPRVTAPTLCNMLEPETLPRRAIPPSPTIVTVSPKISIGEPPDIALAVSDVSVALDAESTEEPLNSTLPLKVIEDAEILNGEPPTI